MIHSSPKYIESYGLPNNIEDITNGAIEISEDDLVKHTQLSSRGVSTEEVSLAFAHYQTAFEFLSKLIIYY